MGTLQGIRIIDKLISGELNGAALQTLLGTASQAGSFAQAMSMRGPAGRLVNSPNGVLAISQSPLAQQLAGASPAVAEAIKQPYSPGRASLLVRALYAGNISPSVRMFDSTQSGITGAIAQLGDGYIMPISSSGSSQAYCSADGVTWAILTIPAYATYTGYTRAAYANGLTFVFGSGANAAQIAVWDPTRTSNAGWASSTFTGLGGTPSAYLSVSYISSLNRYCLSSCASGAIWYSSNSGSNWTQATGTTGFSLETMAASATRVIAAFSGTTMCYYSDNGGQSFNQGSLPLTVNSPRLVYDSINSKFILSCYAAGANNETLYVYTATNPATAADWTLRAAVPFVINANQSIVAGGGGVVIFGANNGGVCLISVDSINWRLCAMNGAYSGAHSYVTYNTARMEFIAAGNTSSALVI